MKKGIENTLWNMKECGCQEDIIREYEKLIESPHREEAVAMLEMYCKQLQEQIEKEYKAVDCMDYLIYEIGKIYPEGRRRYEHERILQAVCCDKGCDQSLPSCRVIEGL